MPNALAGVLRPMVARARFGGCPRPSSVDDTWAINADEADVITVPAIDAGDVRQAPPACAMGCGQVSVIDGG